jgi:hypothetical protein
METNGGWAEGRRLVQRPQPSTEAFIPYYQRSRHIFGDLKIEILDAQGKLVDTVPTSKHRGVNRATWSMHLKPPRVPPAATPLRRRRGTARAARRLHSPMTRGDKVYTTQAHRGAGPARPIHGGGPQSAVRLVNLDWRLAQPHELGGGCHHGGARWRKQRAAAKLPETIRCANLTNSPQRPM